MIPVPLGIAAKPDCNVTQVEGFHQNSPSATVMAFPISLLLFLDQSSKKFISFIDISKEPLLLSLSFYFWYSLIYYF